MIESSSDSHSEDEERPLAALFRPLCTVHNSLYKELSVDFADNSDGETSLSQVGGLLTKAISTVEKTAVVTFVLTYIETLSALKPRFALTIQVIRLAGLYCNLGG